MKYQVVESIGDSLAGDVALTADQRKIAGQVQALQLAYEEKQEQFADAIRQLKQAEDRLKKVKESLYEAMGEAGVKKIESDILRFTYIAPTEVKTVDTKAIQARNPQLWQLIENEYLKTSERRGYVKITDKRGQLRLED